MFSFINSHFRSKTMFSISKTQPDIWGKFRPKGGLVLENVHYICRNTFFYLTYVLFIPYVICVGDENQVINFPGHSVRKKVIKTKL